MEVSRCRQDSMTAMSGRQADTSINSGGMKAPSPVDSTTQIPSAPSPSTQECSRIYRMVTRCPCYRDSKMTVSERKLQQRNHIHQHGQAYQYATQRHIANQVFPEQAFSTWGKCHGAVWRKIANRRRSAIGRSTRKRSEYRSQQDDRKFEKHQGRAHRNYYLYSTICRYLLVSLH